MPPNIYMKFKGLVPGLEKFNLKPTLINEMFILVINCAKEPGDFADQYWEAELEKKKDRFNAEILFIFYHTFELLNLYLNQVIQYNKRKAQENQLLQEKQLLYVPNLHTDFICAFVTAIQNAYAHDGVYAEFKDITSNLKLPKELNIKKLHVIFLNMLEHQFPPYHNLIDRLQGETQSPKLLDMDQEHEQKTEKLDHDLTDRLQGETQSPKLLDVDQEDEQKTEKLDHDLTDRLQDETQSPKLLDVDPEDEQKTQTLETKNENSNSKRPFSDDIEEHYERHSGLLVPDLRAGILNETHVMLANEEKIEQDILKNISNDLSEIKPQDYDHLIRIAQNYKNLSSPKQLRVIFLKYKEMRAADPEKGSWFTFYKAEKLDAVDYLLHVIDNQIRENQGLQKLPPIIPTPKILRALQQSTLGALCKIFKNILPEEYKAEKSHHRQYHFVHRHRM